MGVTRRSTLLKMQAGVGYTREQGFGPAAELAHGPRKISYFQLFWVGSRFRFLVSASRQTDQYTKGTDWLD